MTIIGRIWVIAEAGGTTQFRNRRFSAASSGFNKTIRADFSPRDLFFGLTCGTTDRALN
jgi:hypothetical protein